MNDDAVFEAEIRSMLDRRDPGAALASLGEAIVERLRRDRERSRLRARSRPVVNAVAGLAAVIVLAVIVLGRPGGLGTSPGFEPTPSGPSSPLLEGSGLISSVGPPVRLLALAGAALVGLAVVAARAKRRAIGYVAVTAMLGIVWIGSMIGTSNALGQTGAFGGEPFLERPAGFDSGLFIRADGDDEFRVLVGVINRSGLPLDLVGIARNAADIPDQDRLVRIVGLGYLPDDECCLPSRALAFTRLHLDPGELVHLVILGRAGRCATPTVEAGAMQIDSLPLVYEQLTVLHTAALQLDEPVSILNDGIC
jgi:hypothetical protein